MSFDGRLLVAGALGALVIGRAACGSRGVVRTNRQPDPAKAWKKTGSGGAKRFTRSAVGGSYTIHRRNYRPPLFYDLVFVPDEARATPGGNLKNYAKTVDLGRFADLRLAIEAADFHESESGSRGVVRTNRHPGGYVWKSVSAPDGVLPDSYYDFDEHEGPFVCSEPAHCEQCDGEDSMGYEFVNGWFTWICRECGHHHPCPPVGSSGVVRRGLSQVVILPPECLEPDRCAGCNRVVEMVYTRMARWSSTGPDRGGSAWVCPKCGLAHMCDTPGSKGIVRRGDTVRRTIPNDEDEVVALTTRAYSKHNPEFEWRLGRGVPVLTWARAMRSALWSSNDDHSGTYNLFNVELVHEWLDRFDGILVEPARENSVLLFVTGAADSKAAATLRIMASEAQDRVFASMVALRIRRGKLEFRLWWD